MLEKEGDTNAAGLFVLLFLIAGIYMLNNIFCLSSPEEMARGEKVFIRISGDVTRPGVYGFLSPPNQERLLERAGELYPEKVKRASAKSIFYDSGEDIVVKLSEKGLKFISKGEMSAFHKITLGIPVSINTETVEGLTAVVGIGPQTAAAIVRERSTSGGFSRLDELKSTAGIGDKLFQKIKPYLTL